MLQPFESTPPPIAPLPDGIQRPLWSVMIPAFNCAGYLRQTLASVLAQDLGAEQMQIEVVDDCSTKDDPEAVTRELGGGRVAFYRKPKNAGAIANFNTCIERSRGHLVHILHGDDYVLPGFYRRVSDASRTHSDVAAFFTRCFEVQEDGGLLSMTKRLEFLEQPSRVANRLFDQNDLLTPGAVFRRSFYENNGGFLPALVHCADWEMWVRGITLGGGLFINEPLAAYRAFEGNDSSRLRRTAENVHDKLRLAMIWERQYQDFNRARFERLAAWQAWGQANYFRLINDPDAMAANQKIWRKLTPLAFRATVKAGRFIRTTAKRLLD